MVILLVVGAVVSVVRIPGVPPSDAAMIRQFEKHTATFQTLITMIGADRGLLRVTDEWTNPTDTRSVGVSAERLDTYRRLLREAGIPGGFGVERPGSDVNFFLFWFRESVNSPDLLKNLAYRHHPPAEIYPSLDGIEHDPRRVSLAYRHIRGNWYLVYREAGGYECAAMGLQGVSSEDESTRIVKDRN